LKGGFLFFKSENSGKHNLFKTDKTKDPKASKIEKIKKIALDKETKPADFERTLDFFFTNPIVFYFVFE
jgi:hypothetical protein